MKYLQYPFQLNNVFFGEVSIYRIPNLGKIPGLNVLLNVTSKDDNFPSELNYVIELSTPDDSPIRIKIVLIASYSYIGDNPEEDKNEDFFIQYFNESAYYQLWPNIVQLISILTSQMGMNPIILPTQIIEVTKDVPEDSR